MLKKLKEKYNKDREFSNLIIIILIGITFFITTLIIRNLIIKKDFEFLKKKVFYKFNGWSMMHLFQYITIGYLSPKYSILAFLLGIIFEFIEYFLYLNFKSIKYISYKFKLDPLINFIGLLIGLFLYKIYPNNINLKDYFK